MTARLTVSNPKRDRLLLGAAMLVAITPVWSTAAYSISLSMLLGAWLFAMPWRRPDWRPPFLVGSAIFAASLAAASAAAPNPAAAWEEFSSYYPFLLLFLGADAARSLRDQRAIGIAFLVSAGIAAAAATLSVLGFFEGQDTRFRGTVGIFEYAYAMVIGWSLAAWAFLRVRTRIAAAGCFALSLLFLPAIILNATRASLVTAIAAALVLVVMGWRSWPRLLLLFTPLIAAVPLATQSELGARLLKVGREFRLEDPQSQRQVIWAHAWALFQDHPVIGSGPGAFSTRAAELKGDDRLKGYPRLRHPYRTAYSIPLHLLATSGLIGLLGFLIWTADVAKRFLRGARTALDGAAPALISLAVMLAFGATDMSLLNTRISGLFCLALGVSAGALRSARVGGPRVVPALSHESADLTGSGEPAGTSTAVSLPAVRAATP
ncbi:MAG: O-antigen ligase family protein [Planctomycetota bacterium]|nr:O-antigen ligase family protein [Planctomycetota bacterium]